MSMSYSRLDSNDSTLAPSGSSPRRTWLSTPLVYLRNMTSDSKNRSASISDDESDDGVGHSVAPMHGPDRCSTSGLKRRRSMHWLMSLGVLFLLVLWANKSGYLHGKRPSVEAEQYPCRPPLPPFLTSNPPSPSNSDIRLAGQKLTDEFTRRYREDETIDSISVGVVTSHGVVWEGYWGPKRANETDAAKQGHVDGNSMYRLASISKLFTSVETFILRDKGALNLDDPVKKYIPQLSFKSGDEPITFRQLMSHLSGLGRDWPAGDAKGAWPSSLDGRGPPVFNGLPFPTNDQFYASIASTASVLDPYTLPEYSNAGFALLGLANVAANKAFEGETAPSTHAELIHRDIFAPLGLNGSAFLATDDNKADVAVASIFTDEPNQDFLDAMNPAGGQFSSMYDLAKLMQTLLEPSREESLLRPYTVREWLRPIHSFWDDYSKMGMLWEISAFIDSYGRKVDLYEKAGELAGYHSLFTMNPSSSFGIVTLTTGSESQVRELTNVALEYFQPAFDLILEQQVRKALTGIWTSDDPAKDKLAIEVDGGSLYVTQYLLNGTDVLDVLPRNPDVKRLPLWRTRGNQYRVVPTTGGAIQGCFIPWVMMDSFGYANGVGVNALEFRHDSEADETVVYLPAVEMQLRRK